jgi:Tfp pilus assembly protein PilO
MKPETKKNTIDLVLILSATAVCLVVVNVLFLVFVQSEGKTVKLLKNQLVSLRQQQTIIASSKDIYAQYQSEVDTISAVFPNEDTIPQFIQTIEDAIRSNSDEYALRFTAVTPLKEDDKLYLPVAISAKTDVARLIQFLTKLEKLPYMTHVTSLGGITTDTFNSPSEIQIVFKVYVQNPFTTQ